MARLTAVALCAFCSSTAAFSCSGIGGPASRGEIRLQRAIPARMGAVRQVNTAEFEEAIQDCSTPILVDVFAVWCGPCQLMAPEFEKVAETFGDRCRVLKIDSDEEPDVANALQIRGLPTVLLINDMSVIMRAEGALMADELCQLVEHHAFGGPAPTISGVDETTV